MTWLGILKDVIVRTISEAQANLSALIEAVLAGEQVVVEKSGQPIARLARYQGAAAPRRPGALKGRIKIAEDFDELPDDIAEAFAAR